jgi:hypothetical protein
MISEEKGSGRRSGGKKVPERKAMGRMTKFVKLVISSCDLAIIAARTPREAKIKQVMKRITKKVKV